MKGCGISKDGGPTGPIVRTVKLVIDKLSGIPVRGGIAKNDTMLRVDVFTKAGKFHLVPVYVHHRVTGLPNRAFVAFKDEEEWTLVDESFEFLFSVYSNDLLEICLKKERYVGYYSGCDRSTGALNLWVSSVRFISRRQVAMPMLMRVPEDSWVSTI